MPDGWTGRFECLYLDYRNSHLEVEPTMWTLSSFSRVAKTGLAVVASLAIVAATADARPGKSGSIGSRGDRTYATPPPTNTAPKATSPIERSMTQPGRSAAAPAAAGATAAAAQAAKPSMMRNLLLGGLIGAGLATMFGMGGGLAAVLGFILQALLIAGIVILAVVLVRRLMGGAPTAAPATAAAAGGRPNTAADMNAMQRQGLAGAAGAAAVAPNLSGDDFGVFEQRLSEVQLAYGRNDIDALGRVVTPEMLSYFAKELHENRQKGLSNEIGEPKLLQGDLSETWREANAEYATVAMRYSLYDVTIDGHGRVVEGSRTTPVEATELWTFVRPLDGRPDQWELSAIQQAA